MKLTWVIPASLVVLLAAACSSDDSAPVILPDPTPTSGVATLMPPASPNPAEIELEAEQRAIEQEAAKRVAVLEQAVKAQSTPRDRLSVIVTAYCKAPWWDMSYVDEAEVSALARLYDKYWQAGHQWVRPLDSAAKQPKIGACPDVDTSMSTYAPSDG